jgi:sugar O-acyltransferase (sialic acid O-acetyltransferase NeuD family)
MYLLGGSGHCKVIIDIIQKSNLEVIEGIIDDNPKTDEIFNIPVIMNPKSDFLYSKFLIISIGNNKIRKKIAGQISSSYLTAIHPSSIIATNVIIEEGTVIMAGAILNPDVKVGKHCIVNSGAVVEHDCVLENFVHISPNAALSGNVFIGEGTHVGIGASIIQGVKIGKWVTIGAGTVIINDVPDYAVIVGNPGKIIKYNSIENE